MLKIMLIAGEVSGDRQAALLSRAIRARSQTAMLFGAGGNEMREAGVDVRVQTSHLGVVGFQESLRFLRPLHAVYKTLRRLVRSERPDAIVLIDNEGFNTSFARSLQAEGIPIIFYFAPQVWLWGAWRARSIAKMASLILAVFPREAEAYERAGARVAWVGHPLLDIVKPSPDYHSAFQRVGLDPSRPTIALMPGSRFHELRRLTPVMAAAASRVLQRHPELQVVLPLSAPLWRNMIEEELERGQMKGRVTILAQEVYTILSRCRAAMVKSGTSTLEMALLQVPMVVAYQVSPLTYALGRWLARTRFIAMPNILLGQKIVPEFLQRQVTAQRLADETLRLLEDEPYAAAIRQQLPALRPILGTEGVIERAAARILEEASGGRGPQGTKAR